MQIERFVLFIDALKAGPDPAPDDSVGLIQNLRINATIGTDDDPAFDALGEGVVGVVIGRLDDGSPALGALKRRSDGSPAIVQVN